MMKVATFEVVKISSIIVIGIVIRLMVILIYSIINTHSNTVGGRFYNSFFSLDSTYQQYEECIFLHQRSRMMIPDADVACEQFHYIYHFWWLLYPLQGTVLASMGAFNTLLQGASCIMLFSLRSDATKLLHGKVRNDAEKIERWSDKVLIDFGDSFWQNYWLNPLTAMEVLMPPGHCYNHFLFAVLLTASMRFTHLFFILLPLVILITLQLGDQVLLFCIPSLILLTIPSTAVKHLHKYSRILWEALFSYCLVYSLQWNEKIKFIQNDFLSLLDFILKPLNGHLKNQCCRVTYIPSLGIRWYLDAQMLPEYCEYFNCLMEVVPITCIAFTLQFIAIKSRASTVVAVMISYSVMTLFRRYLSMFDISFIIILFGSFPSIVERMRHLQWIIPGIFVPMAVSPMVFNMWVSLGTGNANYLFFQGVCLWLFTALGIIEFTAAHRIEYNRNFQEEKENEIAKEGNKGE